MELFEITGKEAKEKNWLEGPYAVAEVDAVQQVASSYTILSLLPAW